MSDKVPCPDCGRTDFDSLGAWVEHRRGHFLDKKMDVVVVEDTTRKVVQVVGQAMDADAASRRYKTWQGKINHFKHSLRLLPAGAAKVGEVAP